MFESLDLESFRTVAIAAGLGSVLGVEREIAGKPAGIRTHIFVCAGSALMMVLGQGIIDQFQQQQSGSVLNVDPIRVLQAIVVGISFLGAGTIVHDKQEGVEGLTTAANIYMTAGIGVAVAVERVALASVLTVFAALILVAVGWVENYFGRGHSDDDEPESERNDKS
ncbi:MgtC/SapB family protein [Roseiconus nitratireducens]|uniref:MgtC/SapB family protein n=1 Tax=Roseiconus nitratireducens TaxID=2605748 RepID=A0A5M6DM47_9BACT|nr:MgtC/SapB family protein [Roseiconus nitratireducens]KAA5547299.1 MgtC/SapB family protein [Roseiconus nitratireducens]